MIEQKVTYTLEVEGKLVIIENVPARVCKETGEQFFAPDTVERLQRLIGEKRKPKRVIEVPVLEFVEYLTIKAEQEANHQEEKEWFNLSLTTAMRGMEDEHNPDMLDDYDFSQGVRGKYVQRFAQGSNVIVLSPDIAEIFPDSESVNNALRMLIEIAGKSISKTTA